MTDMGTGTVQSNDTSSPVSSNVSQQSAPNAPQVERQERLFRQEEVNDIVKRVKQDSVDSYRKMQAERPDYIQQKYGDAERPATHSLDEGNYRRIAAEEAQRLRDEWVRDANTKSQEEMAQRTVQNFWNKISPGKEKYQDFEQVTGDIQYAKFPNVVQLLADYVDNSHDVLYELGKDRTKMATIESLAMMSPQDAVIQMQRFAKSIKENETSSKMRLPNEPLSQMRPSTNAGTSNGAMSVSDFRKKYKV